MFFPGKEGYLLFADLNSNEPQIVGEPGAREPIRWLPQSDYSRARPNGEMRGLESEAFGLDKMIGYNPCRTGVCGNRGCRFGSEAWSRPVMSCLPQVPPTCSTRRTPLPPSKVGEVHRSLPCRRRTGRQLAEMKLDSPPGLRRPHRRRRPTVHLPARRQTSFACRASSDVTQSEREWILEGQISLNYLAKTLGWRP